MTEPAAPAVPAAPRTKAGRFAKGHSGNPEGRKPDQAAVRALIAEQLPDVVAFLGKLMRNSKAPMKERRGAAEALLSYGLTKPKDVGAGADAAAALQALADALTSD